MFGNKFGVLKKTNFGHSFIITINALLPKLKQKTIQVKKVYKWKTLHILILKLKTKQC